MTSPSAGPLPGAEHTLFRGYGPFVALVALILAMAFLAPTIAPERDVTTRPAPAADNLRSSGTGGVPQERRNEDGAAAAENLRSSATDRCCK
jgi:hypothetical protein